VVSSQPLPERQPFEQLHGNERLALVLLNSVNRADVGVVQSRSCLGFPLESFQVLSVLGEFFRQELQRDGALEFGVLGLIDHTHTPATQLFYDAVVGDRLADHGRAPERKKPERAEESSAL
jgi:hypothetical protein